LTHSQPPPPPPPPRPRSPTSPAKMHKMHVFKLHTGRLSGAAAVPSPSRSCALWGRDVQARLHWPIHCADARSSRRTAPLVLALSRCRSHTLTCKLRQQAVGACCSIRQVAQTSLLRISWLGLSHSSWTANKAAAAAALPTSFVSQNRKIVSILLAVRQSHQVHHRHHRHHQHHHQHHQPPQQQQQRHHPHHYLPTHSPMSALLAIKLT